jgi:acyl carrier protein
LTDNEDSESGTMEIADKVKEIVCQQLDVDKASITDTSAFIDDLGADSLAIVELVLAFEEQFEIDIPDEDTEKIRTVGDAIKYVESRSK